MRLLATGRNILHFESCRQLRNTFYRQRRQICQPSFTARFLCALSLAVSVAGCDLVFPPSADGAPQIEVYNDRYEYRLGRYTTIRGLAIGLEASTETPVAIALHDCDADDRLEAALDLLRERGLYNLMISLPDDCP